MPHLAQSPTRHYMLNISFMGYDSDYTVIAKISRIFLREGLPHANTAPRTVKDTTPHHVTWEYHGQERQVTSSLIRETRMQKC